MTTGTIHSFKVQLLRGVKYDKYKYVYFSPALLNKRFKYLTFLTQTLLLILVPCFSIGCVLPPLALLLVPTHSALLLVLHL